MPTTYISFCDGVDIEVSGAVSHGGSLRHDSDEPPWSEVSDIEITYSKTGRTMSRRVRDMLKPADWDRIYNCIIQDDAGC